MNTVACPCCGSPVVPPVEIETLHRLKLGLQAQQVLDYYVARYPDVVLSPTLVDHMYQLDPSGGPMRPRDVLSVQVFRINRELKPLGWRVARHGFDGRRLERFAQ